MKAPRLPVAALALALLGTLAVPSGAAAAQVPGRAATTQTAPAGSAACDTDPATPKRQFRAMWIASVVNIDWPSKASWTDPDRIAAQQAEYRGWLDLAQRLHHNAVVVQVRPTADAFWPSPYEPWSEYLTGVRGQDPGWDPLAFLVSEAHKRNLEFHAWFNPYRISMPDGAGADIDKLAPGHPVREHPDWAVAYPVDAPGSRLYYNPGIPAVRDFVQTAIMDAVQRYDLDGVHFDDYFYPYPAAGQDFPDDATFARYGGDFTDRADWRRHNIDLLVQEMNQRIKAAKPWVKFGISPFGIWRNASADPLGSDTAGTQSYDANYADTRRWVKQEWIDYIVPQVYWNIGLAVADYAKLVPWWADVVHGTRVQLYIGQADYKIGDPAQPAAWQDPAEMSRHLAFNQDHPDVQGNIHFSAVQVRANKLGATDIYAAEHYARPALVPAMTHLPAKPLLFPLVTGASRQSDGVRLRWRPLLDGVGPLGRATSYAVYRFDGAQLPTACGYADAAHLVATVRADGTGEQSHLDGTAQPGRTYTYAVTALDRLANESAPSPPRPVR
ncbi:glycoside hydrolase family 10 protein [Plantactinospora sp. KBS50]|uniref:glycoside hydrolase family 10 protein n=1 Tax=Plantactinospora sp. KBS50 TaxID=2024580 RepID=UPI000BAABF52|nr:family 10 glycosylhydrolase [Plantactinospora sp. KBS50]ASW53352.1 glycosyl hydrolase [Plantactinospora sp. KBS50]